jgi:nitronate monooxygenase
VSGLLARLGLDVPLVQAPMAGVSTPAMAAAVSNAGALGSISIAAVDPPAAREAIAAVHRATDRSFLVNVFCHRPPVPDAAREAAWLRRLAPEFAGVGAEPPAALRTIYSTFVDDDAKLALLLETTPRVVSFPFGLPPRERIAALRDAGIALLATVTSVAEGRAAAAAGVDGVVAQGYEAGGHRGVFDPDVADDRLGTLALTRLVVRALDVPVIAAGGIMDGAGIAACLRLGAIAAQLGTAFIGCPESSADEGFRAALHGPGASHTVMTRAISGRPARCLANRFTAIDGADAPDYPIAYDAGKALHAAAKAAGEFGYGAQWAGQGAPLARSMPAAELVALLRDELSR